MNPDKVEGRFKRQAERRGNKAGIAIKIIPEPEMEEEVIEDE